MVKHYTKYINEIDHRAKWSMIKYLTLHTVHAESMFRHSTIANNIKITRLPLPNDLEDLAFDYMDSGNWSFNQNIGIAAFESDHNCKVYQTGRSGGWLELRTNTGQGVFDRFDPNLTELNPIEDIRDLCRLVEAFDQFCDDLLADFISELEWWKDEKAAEAAEAESNRLALLDPPFPMAV